MIVENIRHGGSSIQGQRDVPYIGGGGVLFSMLDGDLPIEAEKFLLERRVWFGRRFLYFQRWAHGLSYIDVD